MNDDAADVPEWRRLQDELQPGSPQQRLLDPALIAKHSRLLELRPANPLKNEVDDPLDPMFIYDVAEANRLIHEGQIQPQPINFPTAYASRIWGVLVSDGAVSQAGGGLDLIWVLRMPPERTTQPCLLYTDSQGSPRLLDGAHRLTRNYIDGLKTMPGLMLTAEETARVRRPRQPLCPES